MSGDRGHQRSRTTGKNRRAADPDTAYVVDLEADKDRPWRDRAGSDMNTNIGFTQKQRTPVLICTTTHEIHVIAEDGTAAANSWAESLPTMGFRKVIDQHLLDDIGVDVDWTVQLGRAERLPNDPRFVALTGVVRGPGPDGGTELFYQGPIIAIPEWIDEAKRRNKILILTKARQGAEEWAVGAHLKRPRA
ncbi:hypothetical protein [Amycolatopsis sp. NPDC004079]|uniref:hypothetical protein n=1 Tax=Amycolatopsis sp. NPDC004079 TaxID=3154549 RepID=UPI0033A614E2